VDDIASRESYPYISVKWGQHSEKGVPHEFGSTFFHMDRECASRVHHCIVHRELHQKKADGKFTRSLKEKVEFSELLCHILKNFVF